MRTREIDALILPGLGNSEEGHWQRRWAANLPNAQIVEQDAWHTPRLNDWQEKLVMAMARAKRPVVLIAHSLGCWLAVQSIKRLPFSALGDPQVGQIAGILLVAPPSRAAILALPGVDNGFAAPPTMLNNHLPCPALLIASVDDPYTSYAESAALAEEFGAELINAGNAGHINIASGHGPWPDGLMQLGRLLKKIDDAPTSLSSAAHFE